MARIRPPSGSTVKSTAAGSWVGSAVYLPSDSGRPPLLVRSFPSDVNSRTTPALTDSVSGRLSAVTPVQAQVPTSPGGSAFLGAPLRAGAPRARATPRIGNQVIAALRGGGVSGRGAASYPQDGRAASSPTASRTANTSAGVRARLTASKW